MHTRRALMVGLITGLALSTLDTADAQPARRRARRRTVRRRTRRRVRRRHRRRVRRRVVAGVSMLVVPVGLAVGWELLVDDTVYVVREINRVDGRETAVIVASSGKVVTEPIVRENTSDNAVELEGSTIPDGDTSTPGIEVEVD